MKKLKPCPFCGEERRVKVYFDEIQQWWFAVCDRCQVLIMATSEAAAIRRWNRRTPKGGK